MNYRTMENAVCKVRHLLYKYTIREQMTYWGYKKNKKYVSFTTYKKIMKVIADDNVLPLISNCKMPEVTVKYYTKDFLNKQIRKFNKENNIKDEDTIFNNCDTIIIRIGQREWGFNANNGSELYSETGF
jgi:hypothetical protein